MPAQCSAHVFTPTLAIPGALIVLAGGQLHYLRVSDSGNGVGSLPLVDSDNPPVLFDIDDDISISGEIMFYVARFFLTAAYHDMI